MTTVAWHHKHGFAADTMLGGDFKCFTHKLRRLKGGYRAGFAGNVSWALRFIRWFEDGADLKDTPLFPEDEDSGFEVLIVAPDGEVSWWNESCIGIKVAEPFYAIGTGTLGAMVLMQEGMTPTQAVRRVMKYDDKTGGGVETMPTPSTRRRRGR